METTMHDYVCVICLKLVNEEDAVWVNDDPHHVECAPEDCQSSTTGTKS
jgi:hypothetical protein